jgi:DNA-binding protein HU-beta
MNKAELIDAVQTALGPETSKRAATESLDLVLNAIIGGLKKDRKVQIVGFGSFEVKQRKGRTGRNPKTGETIQIAPSTSVGFKPSAALKDAV